MRARVCVLGSCNMDLVAFAERAPQLGETVTGERFVTVPGGKGANQAIAVARAGGEVSMIGAVGSDHHGTELRRTLTGAGADASSLRTVTGPTGTAHITVDGEGANSIIVVPSANASVRALQPGDEDVIGAARILLMQLEIPLEGVIAGAEAARRRGVTVVLTPAPVIPLPARLLENVDLILANEHEAAALAGQESDAVDALLTLVPRAVVTLGSRGCVYGARDGERIRVAAPAVEAVDTTAAGDSFAGALAVALAEERPIHEALRWATAAGALAVQKEGASSSMAGRAAIEELARRLSGQPGS